MKSLKALKEGFTQHRFFSQKKSGAGFTLMEILVVMAIIAVFTAFTPKILSSYNKYSLDSNYNELIQDLRSAVIKSMSGESGSGWGVHLVTGSGGSFTLFKGTSYAGRDTDYDEPHLLASSLTLTASSTDIIFSKIEATTTNTGTITLSWPDGNLSKGILVNAYGVLTKI